METSATSVLEGLDVPPSLRTLPRPCRRLFVRGRLPPASAPAIAVVGSRTPSPSGRRLAYEIGRGLARAGVVVVSGLARGVDAAAHRGALDGGGIALAFLGSGIDVVYPRSSRELAADIPERGAVASEYGPGEPPLPYRFVARNRLLAGAARGTVVVEAGARSGALITAGLAVDLGRELWAVGDPVRPTCRGSNRLLRDGAGVVLDAGDLLAAVGLTGPGPAGPGEASPPGLGPEEVKLWRALVAHEPADAETLVRKTALTAARVLEALSMLELAGHVERDGEAFVRTRRGPGRTSGR